MKDIKEILGSEGVPVPVQGNRPMLLADPGSVWLVERGPVPVFFVNIKEDGTTGARSFLFEAREGELLFGVVPPGDVDNEGRKYGLLATGVSGTVLRQTTVDRLVKLAVHDQASGARSLINRWISQLAAGVNLPSVPRLVWPVKSVVKVRYGDESNEDKPIPLEEFHASVLQAAAGRRQSQLQAETRQIKKRINVNNIFMEKAVGKLASIAAREEEAAVARDHDPLLEACRLVGEAMHIKIIPPPPDVRQNSTGDALGDIAAASRLRFRRVALRGEWWKDDNGPLLAFMEDDNRPVALVPTSPSQYRLHDPAKRRTAVVNMQIAREVKPFAVTFYRPFPAKALKLGDVLKLGLEGCWKKDMVNLVLMGILGGILGTATPVATGLVFDAVIPAGERSQLLQIAFFLGASAFAGMLFQMTRSLAMLRLEGKLEGTIQAAVWDRLLSLPVTFFKRFSAGELAMRAMGISRVRRELSGVTITTVLSGIFSVFYFALLFYYDIKLAGVATLLVVVAVAVTSFLGYRQVRFERQTVDLSNRISGLVFQLINGISKFRAAGAESRAFYRWTEEFSRQRELAFKGESVSNWLKTFNSLFPVAASVGIFYTVAGTSAATLGPGNFIAFNTAFTSFVMTMTSLTEALTGVNNIIPLYERAKPILETLPEYDEAKGYAEKLSGSIEVSNVSFRYTQEGPPVLKDVSLQVGRGEYIGIVGTSGSGKSTLFRILLGFEKPESGRVYYDGRDIETTDIRSVRRQLGVVLQNGQLMAGDIFTNIVGADYSLTVDDAWEAAKMAGLDRDIEDMPMGMYTVVSEGAGTFSGGQKQRLLIARAIARKPKIVFFDEATSALDNRTQATVSESLESLQVTRVVIAHRLSTIMNCDRIIVLDKGRVTETGTYRELMAKDGMFAQLARRQMA